MSPSNDDAKNGEDNSANGAIPGEAGGGPPSSTPPAGAAPDEPDNHNSYYFELSGMLGRDIGLADAKAVFSLTIAGLGLAAMASFFGSMPDPSSRETALADGWVWFWNSCALGFAIATIFFAILTVLPRRYIDSNDNGFPSIQQMSRWLLRFGPFADWVAERIGDAIYTIVSNLRGASMDGANRHYSKMLEAPDGVRRALEDECRRGLCVRERKYLWVGLAICCALVCALLVTTTVTRAINVITHDWNQKGGNADIPRWLIDNTRGPNVTYFVHTKSPRFAARLRTTGELEEAPPVSLRIEGGQIAEPVEWFDRYDRTTFNREEVEESINAAWKRFDRNND